MTKATREFFRELTLWFFLGVIVYVGLALSVFHWRHPWMTQTEGMLYIGRALTFGTVDYGEARPR